MSRHVTIHPRAAAVRLAAGRRVYRFEATGPGGQVALLPHLATSTARIREVTARLFRLWTGAAPSFVWASDGRLGEAWDDRGRRLHVEQINEGSPWLRC